ncbi:glycosyl transferase [Dokdonia pacifica]|uniref:Glycosyltransferase involved in cell wall bisynthesis n=1 Tax=Dokdonia pacifica TaxID=1627892 RepID=A0A238Z147_9FLAO|nr:glycosyltransferase [Dokdonia pacifica]GGG08873.1 glycosyl transferase [Dokdonia pacifica]SNR76992.1 Glycosyltransferase involved in cell wall bisynthesis [Dokdonia pacifica]
MKIIHVINSLHFGGAEKLLVDTIPKFIERGITTDVLVLHPEKTFFYNELAQKHQVKIVTTKKKSLYNPLYSIALRKYLKEYDIVHVHLFPSLYWVSLATLFLKNRAKLIVTEHNTDNRRRASVVFKYIDRWIYKKYDKVIAISKGVKENLQSHLKKSNDTIVTIPNGIPIEVFKNATGLSKYHIGIPENAKVIIQVASFTPQKDQDTLLKAISLLPDEVHLLLIGDGVLKEEKIGLATTLNIKHRVHFLGYRTDIPQLLKLSDVSVLSSHYEGFGLAIVEGMAAGNPCIGSNVPGLSEVIGEEGILFEPGNHVQLKNSIEQLLYDKEYYLKIQKQCLDRAQEYDLSFMIDAYINVYKAL